MHASATVMARPIMSSLQDAPAEGAAADAAPAADAAAAAPAAPAAPVTVEGALAVPAGVGPGAGMEVKAAVCAAPCPNPKCTSNNFQGCYESKGVPPMVTWECNCPPPPPPPTPGSLAWQQEDDRKFVDVGSEAAGAGANLAMYESGEVAMQLNR